MVILQGKKDDVRNLCKPWGVQLKAQKHYRPMGTIKQELKTALTKRAMKLKSNPELLLGGGLLQSTPKLRSALTMHSQKHTQVQSESP